MVADPEAVELRVGLVCPYALDTPGGVQNHVLGLAAWLRRQGHHAEVIAPGRVPADLHRRHGSPPVTSAGPVVPIAFNGSVARLTLSPRVPGRLRRWRTAARLDVVHVHEPLTPLLSSAALADPDPAALVATFHTATPRSRAVQLGGAVMAGALTRLDASIAVSEAARRVVAEHLGLDPVVIGNGFDPPPRHPRPERRGPGPRIVFLGRLDEPRKGLDVLLAAWPALRRGWPDAEVVVAGSGRRPLPPEWTALGGISDDERARLLASADVFVAPHRGRESFGLVLLEALAAGVPVVAADLPAFLDVAGPTVGTRVHVFATGDPDDLVRAVGRALRVGADPATDAVVAAVCARYTWDRIGPQLLGVYRRARARARG